jgi:hypothetical protein
MDVPRKVLVAIMMLLVMNRCPTYYTILFLENITLLGLFICLLSQYVLGYVIIKIEFTPQTEQNVKNMHNN